MAVLKEIWRWRENEAIESRKPPYFILAPERMVELAVGAVESRNLHDMLPRHFWPRRRERLLKAIAHGLTTDHPARLPRPKSARQTETERRRMRELENKRDRRATELGIDPTLIASRATLVLLAKDWGLYSKDLMQWQREVLDQA